MCFVGAFAALFLGAAVWNFFRGDLENAKFGFFIGIFLAFFAWILGREENAHQNFLGFLVENEGKLKRRQSVEYRGLPLSLQTEVTQFYVCVSLLIFTTKIPSRFFIRGRHKTGIIGTICSLLTLVFGWWGFPFGPIYTVQSLYANLRGGDKKPISQLLTEIEKTETEPQTGSEQQNEQTIKPPIASPESPWTNTPQ